MADQPTVEVEEIRPCPDGTFNVVLKGAGCDLNFTSEAMIRMGLVGGPFASQGLHWSDVSPEPPTDWFDVAEVPPKKVELDPALKAPPRPGVTGTVTTSSGATLIVELADLELIAKYDLDGIVSGWSTFVARPENPFHIIKWTVDNFNILKRFVDEHSPVDFVVHHQTTTDRLIIRRGHEIPVSIDPQCYLVVEVETMTFSTVTETEVRARFTPKAGT